MKILITGPESTGKTTILSNIVQNFDVSEVQEMARSFLALKNGLYIYEDLYELALLQRYEETFQLSKGLPTICDTDLLTIVIWSIEKYEKFDQQILKWWQENLPLHTFLCKPDIPWQHDPLRENPYDRVHLFQKHLAYLNRFKCDYTILEGSREQRFNIVKDVLSRFGIKLKSSI